MFEGPLWLCAFLHCSTLCHSESKKNLITANTLKGCAFIIVYLPFLCPFRSSRCSPEGHPAGASNQRVCVCVVVKASTKKNTEHLWSVGKKEGDKKNQKPPAQQPLINVWLHFKNHSSALKSDHTDKMEIGFINSDWEVKACVCVCVCSHRCKHITHTHTPFSTSLWVWFICVGDRGLLTG